MNRATATWSTRPCTAISMTRTKSRQNQNAATSMSMMIRSNPERKRSHFVNDTQPMKPEVQVFESVEALQVAAARQVAEALHPTTQGRVMTIALSGGSTPRRFHELLAALPGIDWSRVHIFWGDERTVRPDSDESNYRMAHETLLSHIDIPEENIHRLRGDA